MKIVIGSDHIGYSYKYSIINNLLNNGHEIADVGTHHTDFVDYVEIAKKAITVLVEKNFERVILINETGIGMANAANKLNGAYAAVCNDFESTRNSVIK